MTARTAADLVMARMAADDYRDRAAQLEREATADDLRNMPLTRRILRRYAFIARNAARAEEWSEELA